MASPSEIIQELNKADTVLREENTGQEQKDEAVEKLKPLVKKLPKQGTPASRRLGLTFFKTGASDELALKAYENWLTCIHPKGKGADKTLIEEALVHIAALHHRIGDRDKAIKRAKELYPDKNDSDALAAVESHPQIGSEAFRSKPAFGEERASSRPESPISQTTKPEPAPSKGTISQKFNKDFLEKALTAPTDKLAKAVQNGDFVDALMAYARDEANDDQTPNPLKRQGPEKRIHAFLALARGYRGVKGADRDAAHTEAMARVQDALGLDPFHKAARIERAKVFIVSNELEKALEVATDLMEDFPKSRTIAALKQHIETTIATKAPKQTSNGLDGPQNT